MPISPSQHRAERQVHREPWPGEDVALPVRELNRRLLECSPTLCVEFSRIPSPQCQQCDQLWRYAFLGWAGGGDCTAIRSLFARTTSFSLIFHLLKLSRTPWAGRSHSSLAATAGGVASWFCANGNEFAVSSSFLRKPWGPKRKGWGGNPGASLLFTPLGFSSYILERFGVELANRHFWPKSLG